MGLKFDSAKKLRKEKSKWKYSSPEELVFLEEEYSRDQLRHSEPTIKGQVRISAGKAKNIKIDIPRKTRPVTDRMKVRVFDILGADIAKKNVLDLYAGSGSFGLEAISRGASFATFIDASKHAERILLANVKKTGFLTQTLIIREKVEDFLSKEARVKETYDIIFIDPPYKLYNKKRLYKIEEMVNKTSKLLPGLKSKFPGAILMKHPRRYPITDLELDSVTVAETFDFGLNSISLLIVAK